MQNYLTKISVFFSIFFFSIAQEVKSQEYINSIKVADSLFQQHQYTQAFRIYESILNQRQEYSPQMLLKMAYIKEGLRDYPLSMYYLHLYYSKHPSRAVLKKMEEVAQRHRLVGYEYSDWVFFKTQFTKYYMKILELMLIIAVIVITIMAINWHRGHTFTKGFKVFFITYLCFIFYYINYLHFGREGIIRSSRVPVMSAPSAGSQWLTTITQGHKVSLAGESDIWYEIRWRGKKAFIRKNNVIELP